jgi:8-hydroxy-5-deazaflavin:NADPH oxidoreductase
MNITIIGTGNVGMTLALAFRKAGHSVILGVRNPLDGFTNKEDIEQYGFNYYPIEEAMQKSEIIVLSTPAQFAIEIAKSLGNTAHKIIIDTMNSIGNPPQDYSNTTDAILANTNCIDVVKCFNTTGFENIENPIYNNQSIDMFVAGSSEKAKKIATQLANDIGFINCYDFGGNDKFYAIEQFAFAWINIAIIQKNGRNIAFKIIKR